MTVLESTFSELHQTLFSHGQRLLVWWNTEVPSEESHSTELEGDALQAILKSYPNGRVIISEQQGSLLFDDLLSQEQYRDLEVSRVEPGQSRRFLGQESDVILLDARQSLEPDAFGILSGTLRAGGVCLLMTSKMTFNQRYGARILRLMEQSPLVARLEQGTFTSAELTSRSVWKLQPDEIGCLTPDQRDAALAVSSLKRRRPLILTADRGRGKSAALGIGAALRLKESGGEILVTAPGADSVNSLFEQLALHLPDGRREGHRFIHPNGQVIYVDPMMLSKAFASQTPPGGDGSVLLVDEAAALPTRLLEQCLEHFPRITFATTTHGYEGSGRGFAIRFKQYLNDRTPDWVKFTLETPVRWAPEDPLEDVVSKLLCLDAEPDDISGMFDEVRVERLDRDRLAKSEASIRSVFGLLVLAHYRTTPEDLKRLLDQRPITLWIAHSHGQLLGVCASVDEGGYTPQLAEEVARGERRLPGEILPQSLALHEGVQAAAELRWRRIMRIVVHPTAQRRGVGRKLIDTIAFDAASKGVALLGASFGATPGLIGFWSEVGCLPLRLGIKPERSSGENAVMVGRAMNAEGAAVVRQCRNALLVSLEERLPLEHKELDPILVNELMQPAPIERDAMLETALRRLGDSHAPLTPYRPLLKQHWGALRTLLDKKAQEGMVGLIYQGQDERWLAHRFGQVGRAAGERLWREWCQQMSHPVVPQA